MCKKRKVSLLYIWTLVLLLFFPSLSWGEKPQQAGEAVEQPDTPAGRCAFAYIEAFNSGDEGQIGAFWRKYMGATKDTLKKRIEEDKEFLGVTGALTPFRILYSSKCMLSVQARCEKGGTSWFLDFHLKSTRPYSLVSNSLVGPVNREVGEEELMNFINVNGQMRRKIIDQVTKLLKTEYVSLEKAEAMAALIRKKRASGEYDDLTKLARFTAQLTKDLCSLHDDGQLIVGAGVNAAGLMIHVPPSTAAGQDPDAANNPELNFEHAWKILDRTYGQFINKRVDWDALYKVYRPQITPDTDEEKLFDIIAGMISHLNDKHVWLISTKRSACSVPESTLQSDDFSYSLVKSQYLSGGASTALGGALTSGWVADGVGYIHIRDFKAAEHDATTAMDAVLSEFADASSIIVDVRNNPGGDGQAANRLADRFADRKRHFMSSAMRYGPEHDDTLPMHFYVKPRGPLQFNKSTILLVNQSTASAAERFTLAMRVLPHVTVVGDYSAGAFSAQYPARMPNGWELLISYKMSVDHTGICWDGVGVMPDLFCRNTDAKIKAGTDRALEFAIMLLEQGPLKTQDESASLLHIRTSLVEAYMEGLEEGGIEAAVSAIERVCGGDPDSFFLDVKHCLQSAHPFVFNGRPAEVIPLLELCLETYPQVAMTYGCLAAAYSNNDDPDGARVLIDRGEMVTPMYPWERPVFDKVKAELK